MIEPAGTAEIAYFGQAPEAFEVRGDELLVVPLHHIFGSEELSVLSPGIAERAPKPYLAVSPEDAERLRAREGSELEIVISGKTCRLPFVIVSSLPRGIAGLPVLAGSEGIALPAWGRVGGKG